MVYLHSLIAHVSVEWYNAHNALKITPGSEAVFKMLAVTELLVASICEWLGLWAQVSFCVCGDGSRGICG